MNLLLKIIEIILPKLIEKIGEKKVDSKNIIEIKLEVKIIPQYTETKKISSNTP